MKKRSRLRWLSTLHIQFTQSWLWINENHICERQIKKWMKAIFAIMKIIWAVDKNKAWKKNSGWGSTYHLCDLGALLWCRKSYGSKFRTGLNFFHTLFSLLQVVFISAEIAFIHHSKFLMLVETIQTGGESPVTNLKRRSRVAGTNKIEYVKGNLTVICSCLLLSCHSTSLNKPKVISYAAWQHKIISVYVHFVFKCSC